MMNKRNIGSSLDSLFEETGELEEINERVFKRIFAEQFRAAMQRRKLSATIVAKRMNTSRTAVYHLLDPEAPGVTLRSLARASETVGMRLVPRLEAEKEEIYVRKYGKPPSKNTRLDQVYKRKYG